MTNPARQPGQHTPDCSRTGVYGHPGDCVATQPSSTCDSTADRGRRAVLARETVAKRDRLNAALAKLPPAGKPLAC